MAMEKLDDLDKEQKEAVMSAPENPLVIFAGAGSGKTTTLIRRMSFAMVMGEDPSGVLCLTFSRSAAEDLRARVGSHCGAANARAATICTFHGFCLRLLRRHLASMPQYGYREGFHICARQEQREVIEQCLGLWLETDSGKLDAELVRPGAMARVISSTVREIERRKMGPPDAVGEPRLEFVIGHYRAALVFANAVDYSDLLLLTVQILADSEEVRTEYHRKYTAAFIDEFQDTTELQLDVVRLIGCPRVTVVGDDDQSIVSDLPRSCGASASRCTGPGCCSMVSGEHRRESFLDFLSWLDQPCARLFCARTIVRPALLSTPPLQLSKTINRTVEVNRCVRTTPLAQLWYSAALAPSSARRPTWPRASCSSCPPPATATATLRSCNACARSARYFVKRCKAVASHTPVRFILSRCPPLPPPALKRNISHVGLSLFRPLIIGAERRGRRGSPRLDCTAAARSQSVI